MKFTQTTIAAAAAKLRADAAGNKPATMTDIDEAVAMLQELAYLAGREEDAEKQQENARSQAKAQAESIAEMVAALEVDYDRLQELKDERDGYDAEEWTGRDGAEWASDEERNAAWAQANPEDAQELAELEEAAGDCTSQDDAQQRISEDPLSIEVRSGWQSAGEELTPADFTILLCTGGPACRIVGELNEHNEPDRAWIEYQDWFTPWVEYHGDGCSSDDLLTYCRQFYFSA